MRLSARVVKRRGASFLLDLSVEADPGLTVLFGPSGAGKTSFLACLAGLLKPDDGEIRLGERWIHRPGGPSLPPEARGIGYVPQDLRLFPHLTVAGNLDFGYPASPTPPQRRRREELIEALQLAPHLAKKAGEISGGEAQRCAVARALLRFPELLLMDEPLTSLDRRLKEKALADLLMLKREIPIPILYVTHSASEVLALADRVILLRQGRRVREGGVELAFDPEAGGAEAADAMNFLEARVESIDPGRRAGTVRWGEQTLRAGNLSGPPGGRAILTVSPHDILVSVDPPGRTSARNVLRSTVADRTESGDQVLIRFAGPSPLFASVTPEACRELDLSPGREVFLLVKSTALRAI